MAGNGTVGHGRRPVHRPELGHDPLPSGAPPASPGAARAGIAETLKRGARADLAQFGIGTNRPRSSSLVRTGFLSCRGGRGHGVRLAHRRRGSAFPVSLERAAGRDRGGGAPAHPQAHRGGRGAREGRSGAGGPAWWIDRRTGGRRRAGPGGCCK